MKAQKNNNGTVSITGMTMAEIERMFDFYEHEKNEMKRCGYVPKSSRWMEDCIFEAANAGEGKHV